MKNPEQSPVFVFAWVFAVVLVILSAGCDKDKPREDKDEDPKEAPTYKIDWEEEDLNAFVIYACYFFDDSLYVLDLLTGEIKHQLKGFHRIASLLTNRDGTRLYVSTSDSHAPPGTAGIFEVKTDTWERKKIYHNPAFLLSNNNGGVFFITQFGGKSMRMFGEIDTVTSIAREIDSIDVKWSQDWDEGPIAIHPSKPILYARSPLEFYRYNYQEKTKTTLPFLGNLWFILSGGGDTLYNTGSVVDLVNQKRILSIQLPTTSAFYIAARRDNKEIYITAPDKFNRWPNPPGKIYIFSPISEKLVSEIDAEYYVPGNQFPYRTTGRIYLTPGQRYAVVGDDWAAYYIIDLKDRKIIATKTFVKENLYPALPMDYFYLAPKPAGL